MKTQFEKTHKLASIGIESLQVQTTPALLPGLHIKTLH